MEALSTQDKALSLKALSMGNMSGGKTSHYPCFYAKNEIFLLFTIVESIQCCLFVKQVLVKVFYLL